MAAGVLTAIIGAAKPRRYAENLEISIQTEMIGADAEAGDDFEFATDIVHIDIAMAGVIEDFGPIAHGQMI